MEQLRVRVNLEAIAMKGDYSFPKAPGLKPRHPII